MTATNTTGLFNNGVGSAEGKNKGSARMTLGADHLIGARVVAAGVVDMNAAGAVTVTFPQPLAESETSYAIVLTAEAAPGANAPYVSARTDSSADLFESFTITEASGSGNYNVNWVVIKI